MPSRRTLGGFYVHRQIGGGAAGSVFVVTRAEERHDPHAERFALKVPDYNATAARSLSETDFLKLFREEAGALLAIPEHESLARFVTFDAGARPKPILVMELVDGTRCDTLLASRLLTMESSFALLDGVLAGLVAMHGVGVGHLDIKPSNVILRDGAHPVLVDFGLAGRHLRPGCGTSSYGAPEVWGIVPEGVTATPMAADIYSFGCLAYEVLTGETLFDAPNEVALISAHLTHDGVPPPVKRLRRSRIATAGVAGVRVSQVPAQRIPTRRATAAEARAELKKVAAGSPTELAGAGVGRTIRAESDGRSGVEVDRGFGVISSRGDTLLPFGGLPSAFFWSAASVLQGSAYPGSSPICSKTISGKIRRVELRRREDERAVSGERGANEHRVEDFEKG